MKSGGLRIIAILAGAFLLPVRGIGRPAQAGAASPQPAIGMVTAVENGQFTLHTDSGSNLAVHVPDGIIILRVPPGARNLSSAVRIPLSEITLGDRVLVRGNMAEDHKSMTAVSVIVMTKTDIEKEHEAERLKWQQQGIAGVVKTVDPAANQITLAVPNVPPTPANPTHLVTLTLAPNTTLLRYAPDSVKFSDAKPGTLDQIRPGDQVRALGTLNAQGDQFTAQEVVSGTFLNIGATVISADAAKHTLTVKDLATGKTLLVKIDADTEMHTLPPFVAMMIARFNSGGAGGGAPARPGGAAGGARAASGYRRPGGVAGPAGRGGPGGPARNFNQMLNQTPALALSDVKPGEPLIVVSTEGTKPGEVTAIAVLAGVEPILEARPKGSKEVRLGPWNLSIGGGGSGGGSGGGAAAEGTGGLGGGP
jgi:hypothetical protein